mmetsp:Transcript_77623/g.217839  ORF Transcript_77623/g.217839 Transcript_77623/m.217839 type:complete len:246 (-) Transcript_77623:291-1028(-)
MWWRSSVHVEVHRRRATLGRLHSLGRRGSRGGRDVHVRRRVRAVARCLRPLPRERDCKPMGRQDRRRAAGARSTRRREGAPGVLSRPQRRGHDGARICRGTLRQELHRVLRDRHGDLGLVLASLESGADGHPQVVCQRRGAERASWSPGLALEASGLHCHGARLQGAARLGERPRNGQCAVVRRHCGRRRQRRSADLLLGPLAASDRCGRLRGRPSSRQGRNWTGGPGGYEASPEHSCLALCERA